MSSDKIPDKYAGAPSSVRVSTAPVYDLFKTFRHAPPEPRDRQSDLPPTPAIKPEK
jgi:hypothetical protein